SRIPVTYITNEAFCLYAQRADETVVVKDYHAFAKAINHHLITSGKAFGIFLDGYAVGFDEYKEALLQENFNDLLQKSGVDAGVVEKIAQGLIETPESVIIVSEKTVDQPAFCEWKNTIYLTEKQGKMSSGMMTLKTACNSQGLYDMGILPHYGPGFRKIEGDYLSLLRQVWKTDDIPTEFPSTDNQKEAKNIFIFGENPVAEHPQTVGHIKAAQFVCVQSLFENETTALADLVLPMNFAIEIGGSFTTSFKVAQSFGAVKACEFGWNDYHFYAQLQEAFGVEGISATEDIFLEIISLLQPGCCSDVRHKFESGV
ncbi:MAG: molybdopterin-dependent oxidoreductase, partial [Bacteroidales bacterium]|nr:molybdopterin-dependent oxidoreductase [Bacteroidales bacterium]